MCLKFCEQNLIHYIIPHEAKLSARPEGSQFGAQMGEVELSLEPSDPGGEGFRSLWPPGHLDPIGNFTAQSPSSKLMYNSS